MRIALAFLLVGCVGAPERDGSDTGSGSGSDTGSGSGSDTGSGSDAGSGSGSAEPDPPPPPPIADGTYAVRTMVDITVEALLPQSAADMVITLRDFSTNPAHTLLDLAEDAGVPAVEQIRDDLPDYVEDKLEGWINDQIAELKINDVPITQIAGSIAALAETSLTQFALDSTLSIDNGVATHTLVTLDLNPAGLNAYYVLEELPNQIISATATCSSANETFSIGDHGYGLAYGEYMWSGLNHVVLLQYGADIRGLLGAAMNCPALAQAIADKCYWDYCVGHEVELTEICERGLDEVVDRAHAKFSAMRFDAIHFAAGTAALVDANDDGSIERLDSGVWTAEINAGMGLRPVPATFTATR